MRSVIPATEYKLLTETVQIYITTMQTASRKFGSRSDDQGIFPSHIDRQSQVRTFRQCLIYCLNFDTCFDFVIQSPSATVITSTYMRGTCNNFDISVLWPTELRERRLIWGGALFHTRRCCTLCLRM